MSSRSADPRAGAEAATVRSARERASRGSFRKGLPKGLVSPALPRCQPPSVPFKTFLLTPHYPQNESSIT